MLILKRQVNFFSDFWSFFSVITYNASISLLFMHFLLWTKGSHENINFDIFKWSNENLPNCSCYFANHKSVFLQILNDSSVSWNILLCNFFRSNVLYTWHRGTNQCANVLDFLVLWLKFTKFLSFLKQKVSFSSNYVPLFGIMRYNFSMFF